MIKRTLLLIYFLLSIVQVYIFITLSNQLFEATGVVKVNFVAFEISNSILLLIFIVGGIIIGGINIILPESAQDIQKSSTEEAASESTTLAEQINQEIQNKYEAKLEQARTKAAQFLKAEKNNLEHILWHVCKETDLAQGLLYTLNPKNDEPVFELTTAYAFMGDRESISKIELGIGVNGQVAKSGEPVYIKEVPKGYMKVISGLGEASPDYLAIIPIKSKNNTVVALAELAGFGILNNEEVKTLIEITQLYFLPVLDKSKS